MKEKYINKLKSTTQKVKDTEQMQNEIYWMIADVQNYLNNEIEEACVTTQSKIGMKYLFRGWVTRHWTNVNERPQSKMHEINKILIRQSVTFYSEA